MGLWKLNNNKIGRLYVMQAYLTDLIQWNTNGDEGDQKYTYGIIIITIYCPQDDAGQLENVERVQNLKR